MGQNQEKSTSSMTDPIVSQTYDLTNFSAISSSLDGNVYFSIADTYSVVIQAQQFILDIIEAEVVNNTAQFEFTTWIVPSHLPITITITAPSLVGVTMPGSGNFYTSSGVSGTSLNLVTNGSGSINFLSYSGQNLTTNISGNGNITISGGSVTTESLTLNGSGSMALSGIAAATANTTTNGSGNMHVNVTTTLNVTISGSGNVYYTGNPTINKRISGSGKVIQE